MQPIVAKLPALLLSAKSSTTKRPPRSAVGSTARPRTSASTRSSHSRLDTPTASDAESLKPSNNQETHDAGSTTVKSAAVPRAAPPIKKPKKPSSAPLTALEQVQKRKKMFAKWVKRAASESSSDGTAADSSTVQTDASPPTDIAPTTRLPPISPSAAGDGTRAQVVEKVPGLQSHTQLPPIAQPPVESTATGWDFLRPYQSISLTSVAAAPTSASHVQTAAAPSASPPSSPTKLDQDDAEDSLDEDEVNNFLNWTDTLATPFDIEALDD